MVAMEDVELGESLKNASLAKAHALVLKTAWIKSASVQAESITQTLVHKGA